MQHATHHEQTLSRRSLITSAQAAVFIWGALLLARHPGWALGFAIGALCSLFSLFTLGLVVPMLLRPGVGPKMRALLGVTLFMKLPLYCAGLYLATRGPMAQAMGATLGIALVPVVITLKTLGGALVQSQRFRVPTPAVTNTTRPEIVPAEARPASAQPLPALTIVRASRPTRAPHAEPEAARG